MNYYEHHLGDYAEATAHLSILEDGTYSRLLRKIYSTERPLPPEKVSVYRLIGARTKDERRAIDSVLAEFFELRDDGWHNERADREIARFQDKQRKAKASADARWSESGRNANASKPEGPETPKTGADAMRTHSEGNAPRARSSPQSPVTSLVAKLQTIDPSGLPNRALPGIDPAPPSPPAAPPEFTGLNDEALNGKAVVPIAKGFELPEEWGRDAQALGFPTREVLYQAERFRQYWTVGKGAGTRRSVKGWRQSWSTWLGKAATETKR